MQVRSTSRLLILVVLSLLSLFLFATAVSAAAPVLDTAASSLGVNSNLVVVTVPFTDEPGNTQTALINWGDGITDPGLISGNLVTGGHIYATTGNFIITITLTDNEGFTAIANIPVTVTTISDAIPAAAQCAEYNGRTGSPVLAGVPDAIRAQVYCRLLNVDALPYMGIGALPAGNGTIGNQAVLNQGVLQAVDVFSPTGLTTLTNVTVCLRGAGNMVFLGAPGMPRTPTGLGSFNVPSLPGYTCAGVPTFGTVVLVQSGVVVPGTTADGTGASPFVLPTPTGYTAGLMFAQMPQCTPATRGVVFVRAQPTTASAQLGVLGHNTPVTIQGMVGEFYLINAGWLTGYVRVDLIGFQCAWFGVG